MCVGGGGGGAGLMSLHVLEMEKIILLRLNNGGKMDVSELVL